jgi:hypothetical protein
VRSARLVTAGSPAPSRPIRDYIREREPDPALACARARVIHILPRNFMVVRVFETTAMARSPSVK